MSLFAKAKKARENKKGFTLVELIVVLVILAILMAVLIPALLGWIDKAKESQITTNANAVYTATQGLLSEQYGLNDTTKDAIYTNVTHEKIQKLAEIKHDTWSAKFKPLAAASNKGHDAYKIGAFSYTEGSNTVYLTTSGGWTTDSSDSTIATGVGEEISLVKANN